jgi:hypothetical protein
MDEAQQKGDAKEEEMMILHDDPPVNEFREGGITSCIEMNNEYWDELSDESGHIDCDNIHSDASSRPATTIRTVIAKMNPPASVKGSSGCNRKKPGSDCQDLFRAVAAFWPDKIIDFKNVARSVQNIKSEHTMTDAAKNGDRPRSRQASPDLKQLEVNIVVCPKGIGQSGSGNDSAMRLSSLLDGDDISCDTNNAENVIEEDTTARLQLVRIVNGTPLLDGVEAQACGLVQGVGNKSLWGQFGLIISQRSTMTPTHVQGWTPSFDLQDSARVTPFLQRSERNHRPLSSFNQVVDAPGKSHHANKTNPIDELLNPAHFRLGQVLVVVRIHAAPTSLPLPTLCKVRKRHCFGKHPGGKSIFVQATYYWETGQQIGA